MVLPLFNRVLATVKNSTINTVFPIWLIVELPNLFPKYLMEYQNVKVMKSKFKNEKSNKNKHKKQCSFKRKREKKSSN